jgi:hypothetical protein
MLRDYTRTFPPRIFILYKPDACQRTGPLNLTGARYASSLSGTGTSTSPRRRLSWVSSWASTSSLASLTTILSEYYSPLNIEKLFSCFMGVPRNPRDNNYFNTFVRSKLFPTTEYKMYISVFFLSKRTNESILQCFGTGCALCTDLYRLGLYSGSGGNKIDTKITYF